MSNDRPEREYVSIDEHNRIVQHLQGRIASQRRHITSLLANRRVVIGRRGGWSEGREALLKEQLHHERTRLGEAERKLRVAEAALAALTIPGDE